MRYLKTYEDKDDAELYKNKSDFQINTYWFYRSVQTSNVGLIMKLISTNKAFYNFIALKIPDKKIRNVSLTSGTLDVMIRNEFIKKATKEQVDELIFFLDSKKYNL
jgi:hypothetical protein